MRNPDNLWRLLILDLDERDNIAENSKTEPPSQVAYIIHNCFCFGILTVSKKIKALIFLEGRVQLKTQS